MNKKACKIINNWVHDTASVTREDKNFLQDIFSELCSKYNGVLYRGMVIPEDMLDLGIIKLEPMSSWSEDVSIAFNYIEDLFEFINEYSTVPAILTTDDPTGINVPNTLSGEDRDFCAYEKEWLLFYTSFKIKSISIKTIQRTAKTYRYLEVEVEWQYN